MDLGSIFLLFALAILVALFISRPLFERRKVSASQAINGEEHERSSLLAERDRILNALQELDFDHTLGKIPEEDYPQQRTVLLQSGAEVLRRLDEMQPKEASEKGADDIEARIEAAIAARRADAAVDRVVQPMSGNGRKAAARGVSAAIASPEEDLEVMLANRRRARQEKAVGFCPKCGAPLHKSDHFCPKCGTKI